VASILPTPEVDVQASSSQLFESVIVPSKDADYVAYDPALNLELVLNVSFARPSSPSGVEAPVLKAGGHLRLPLLEYADPVSDLFAGAAGLELNLTQGAERRVPPGGSASVDLRATGPAGHYRLRALGPEASWIEVRSDGLHVNDEGVGGARLAIHVPANATADSIVDFVIEAAGGPADAVRSLVRLRVTVDPDAPDESATLGKAEGKGSPGLGPVALVSLLALVALAARRRRL
jgi:MYXO-CTERM domain-containing protein